MALTPQQLSYLKSLARRGDMEAHAMLYAMVNEVNLGSEKHISLVNPAAKSATSVHGTLYGDAAGPVAAATGITNPTIPRNLRCTFGHTWDGGDVTVTGTDQFDAAQTETFTAAIDTVAVGVKIFKTVTGVAYAGGGSGTHATNTLTVGTGDKLGCGVAKLINTFGECRIETGAEDPVILDSTVSGFTPTTVPDGAHDYDLLVHVDEDYTP